MKVEVVQRFPKFKSYTLSLASKLNDQIVRPIFKGAET